jgi:hypothetical protein
MLPRATAGTALLEQSALSGYFVSRRIILGGSNTLVLLAYYIHGETEAVAGPTERSSTIDGGDQPTIEKSGKSRHSDFYQPYINDSWDVLLIYHVECTFPFGKGSKARRSSFLTFARRCTAGKGKGHQPQSSHAVTFMATLSGAKICRARLVRAGRQAFGSSPWTRARGSPRLG